VRRPDWYSKPDMDIQVVSDLQEFEASLLIFAHSNCTTNVIKQYLQGTIPEDKNSDDPDVVCEVDIGPFAGNTPWNITTSKNGDQYTSGPTDPGLINFPGINPPPLAVVDNSQSGTTRTSRLGWWAAVLTSFTLFLSMA
ncbi:2431_t:CDS:2, partial [Acaulospora colombiana]